jgi:hypothetical protein
MRAILLQLLLFSSNSIAQQSDNKTLKELLCAHPWKMLKMTDISGSKRSMDADFLAVSTTFKKDGTLVTNNKGKIINDNWLLNEQDSSMITSQITDPKTAQEKQKIMLINETKFVVQITYRGNNIMQYEYEATEE